MTVAGNLNAFSEELMAFSGSYFVLSNDTDVKKDINRSFFFFQRRAIKGESVSISDMFSRKQI